MTRDEVLAMVPGRELDALIEHEVIGTRRPAKGWTINPKHYSTDISAAWEVVDMLKATHWIDVSVGLTLEHLSPYMCQIGKHGAPGLIYAYGETSSEAICKAALLAVMDL